MEAAARWGMIMAAGLLMLHGAALWRWWGYARLRRLPAVPGKIVALQRVESEDGGSSQWMTFEYTPQTGPRAGQRQTGRAKVRALARHETCLGQTIQVHAQPCSPWRTLTPTAGNPGVPALVMLACSDVAWVALALATRA